MLHNSKSISVPEPEAGSKNGTNSKSQTSRGNFLRKACFALLAASIFSAASVSAQKMAVGAHLATGTGDSNVGLGGKLQYTIFEPIRLDASFTYIYGGNSETPMGLGVVKWTYGLRDFSVNGHYLFYVGDIRLWGDKKTSAFVYPIAGVGFFKATATSETIVLSRKAKDTQTATRTGMNIGVGFEQEINDKFKLYSELKYSVGNDLSRLTFLVGIAFCF